MAPPAGMQRDSAESTRDDQRARGVVYTPPWIVRRVVSRTLGPLTQDAPPDEILGLRVLDPACGDGAFLLGVFDHLEEALLDWARRFPRSARSQGLIRNDAEATRLAAPITRRIIGCLHGVDIDPDAVAAARESLELRFFESAAGGAQEFAAALRSNLRQGNFLLESDTAETGFHAVVGNPPYVEAKRYKEWLPEMHRHLKEAGRFVTAVAGKTDLALPFMEQSVRRLLPGGRLGFIVPSRFFKTAYGESARRWLREETLLQHVEDFQDLQVFPGHTTYTAILVLQGGSTEFEYRTYDTLASARNDAPAAAVRRKTAALSDGPWSLDQPDLHALHTELATRHQTIGQHPDLEVSVGLQALYGKLYQLNPERVTARTVFGVNGFGDTVALERGALRPLCRNLGFYPFRTDNADAWVIFPYDVDATGATEIRWPEFQRRFPEAARYLERNRSRLEQAVQVPAGDDRWHLYTRPQNLIQQAGPKLLFPMTIADTVAAVDSAGLVYQDNVNVNSMTVRDGAIDLHAIAAIFNSTLFSALARLTAGLNRGGWRKLNRQFVRLVPFPFAALRAEPAAKHLSALARDIATQQDRLLRAQSAGQRHTQRASLRALWEELDASVERLYGLTEQQRAIIARHPRRLDRVELPLRKRRLPEHEGAAPRTAAQR